MAFSLTQQPQAYMPAYNPIIYQGQSSNYAISDFYYKITITDFISSQTAVYKIPPRPDGYFIFDASPFAQNYFINYIPINTYGIQYAEESVRLFTVLVQEFYTGALHTINTYSFTAWNSAIDTREFASYAYLDYIFQNTPTVSTSVLTDSLNEVTYADRSNYWYYLASETQYVYQRFRIKTYDSAGTLLGTSYFEDSQATNINYRKKYICIDFGHKGLTEVAASAIVTGTYPIMTDSVAYYTVDGERTNAASTTVYDMLKRYDVKCSKFPVYTIHALFDNGHFRSIHFSKVSEKSITKNAVSYKQIPFENNSNVWEYSRHSSGERLLSVTEDNFIKLRTDWLTPDECELFKQVITSPICYLDEGSDLDYTAVLPLANGYKIYDSHNGWFQLELDFKYTLSNYKQRG